MISILYLPYPASYLAPHLANMSEFSHEELVDLVKDIRNEFGALRDEVTLLNDIQVIRTLHFKYGYYWDNMLYEQIIDLFTDDVRVQTAILYN